jgi:hypothetical protein
VLPIVLLSFSLMLLLANHGYLSRFAIYLSLDAFVSDVLRTSLFESSESRLSRHIYERVVRIMVRRLSILPWES